MVVAHTICNLNLFIMPLDNNDLQAIRQIVAESEERMKREVKVAEVSIKADLTAEIRAVGADVSRLNANLLAHTQNQAPWRHDPV